MRKNNIILILFILVGIFILPRGEAYAQGKATVENVDFFVDGENLIITYDITKARTGATFDVSVEISTVKGQKLRAYSLSGDVGQGVYGGRFKRIVWDLAKDNVFIDDEIFVEVEAKASRFSNSDKSTAGISVGGAMLRSAVFPGWGNSYAKGGGPYWLIGIAAYGSLGGAIYFNNQAYNQYEDYQQSTDSGERDQYYQDATDSHNMQKTLLIAAGAIWLADIVWTGLQASKVNKQARQNKVSLGYYYDPQFRAQTFSVSLKIN
jgi:hypothetical protein